MKYIISLLLTLNALFAITMNDIKNIVIEDLHVYGGLGYEYVDVLDGEATNLIGGATAFAPNIHDLVVLEVSASLSISPASQSTTTTTQGYDVTILNAGGYVSSTRRYCPT